MSEYNRQYYTDRIQTPTPGHQPIYMQVPLTWITNLSTQVVPRDLSSGAASPVLIGVASKSGAVIESFAAVSLGGVAFGAAEAPVDIRIYTRREPDDQIQFVKKINLFSATLANSPGMAEGLYGYPILPSPERAWRLEPGQEVYVALNQSVAAPGLNFFFFGGHYS